MFSQKQKTDVMISNVADDVKVVNGADGTDIAAAGEKLLFKQLLPDGTIRTSGIIKPSDVKYVSKQVAVVAAASTAVFTCVASGTGYAHSVILKLRNWGSVSTDDHEFIQLQYVEEAGDTATDIAAGLVANVPGSSNAAKLFTFGASTGTVTITEKLTTRYVRGKIGYERLVFDVSYKIFDSVGSDDFTTVTVTKTKGAENPLDARRVCDIEWFAMANYGDMYDGAGWPHNREREYIASKDETYVVSYLIQTAKPGEGTTYGINSEATLQIFCNDDTDVTSDAAKIEAALETALGITIPAGTGIVDLK